MSIVKNTAGQIIPIGTMLDLSGAAVTSGASVTVSKDGGVAAAGGGTLSYAGGWWYAPTQAETNCNSLIVTLTKSGAADISQSVITQEHSRTLINANLDATVSSRSTLNAAGVRTELATELGRIDATITSRSTLTAQQVWEYGTRQLSSFGTLVSDIAAAVWSAGGRTLSSFGFGVTVTTNNDKSGYTLNPTEHNAIQSAIEQSGSVLASLASRASELRLAKLDVTGTLANTDNASTFKADVSGLLTTTGYANSLPANFSLLAISPTGTVTDQDAGGGSSLAYQDIVNAAIEALETYTAATAGQVSAVATAVIAEGNTKWTTATGFAVPGDEMGLTEVTIDSLAVSLETVMMDEAIGVALRQAFADKLIENLPNLDDLSLTAIRDMIERAGGPLDTLLNSRLTEARAAKLDRDIAHAADAGTYKADVSGLATSAEVSTVLAEVQKPKNFIRAIDRFGTSIEYPENTVVDARTPTGGGSWVYNTTSNGTAILRGDRYMTLSGWNCMYKHSIVLDKNQWAALDIETLPGHVNTYGAGPSIRVMEDETKMINGRYSPSNGGEWQIASHNGVLATAPAGTLPERCRLLIVGIEDDVYLFVNGVMTLHAVEPDYRDPGGVGFRLYATSQQSITIRPLFAAFAGGEVSITNHLQYDPNHSVLNEAEQAILDNLDAMAATFGEMQVDGVYTVEALANAPAGGGGGGGSDPRVLALLQADVSLDRTVTPHEIVWYEAGTATEIMRKQAFDRKGEPVRNSLQPLGSLVKVP